MGSYPLLESLPIGTRYNSRKGHSSNFNSLCLSALLTALTAFQILPASGSVFSLAGSCYCRTEQLAILDLSMRKNPIPREYWLPW